MASPKINGQNVPAFLVPGGVRPASNTNPLPAHQHLPTKTRPNMPSMGHHQNLRVSTQAGNPAPRRDPAMLGQMMARPATPPTSPGGIPNSLKPGFPRRNSDPYPGVPESLMPGGRRHSVPNMPTHTPPYMSMPTAASYAPQHQPMHHQAFPPSPPMTPDVGFLPNPFDTQPAPPHQAPGRPNAGRPPVPPRPSVLPYPENDMAPPTRFQAPAQPMGYPPAGAMPHSQAYGQAPQRQDPGWGRTAAQPQRQSYEQPRPQTEARPHYSQQPQYSKPARQAVQPHRNSYQNGNAAISSQSQRPAQTVASSRPAQSQQVRTEQIYQAPPRTSGRTDHRMGAPRPAAPKSALVADTYDTYYTPTRGRNAGKLVHDLNVESKWKNQMATMESQLSDLYKAPPRGRKQFSSKHRLSAKENLSNAQITSARAVMSTYMKHGELNRMYKIDGKPAGMMSMSRLDGGGIKIHGVIALPNTKGVGLAAIKEAAQLAAENKCGLELNYLDQASHDFYKRLGFRDAGHFDPPGSNRYIQRMTLDPQKTEALANLRSRSEPRFVEG